MAIPYSRRKKKGHPSCYGRLRHRVKGGVKPRPVKSGLGLNVEWLMQWPIGSSSLDSMPDLLWLDWEVDPADMEKPDNYQSPNVIDATGREYVYPSGNHKKPFRVLPGQVKDKPLAGGPIPRVATGIKDRVNRLKALGNGQVPAVVATAWNILTGDWFADGPRR